MSGVRSINRTLDHEVVALLRRASLECLACGEFVLHRGRAIECPECGVRLGDEKALEAGLQLGLQAG